MEERGKFKGDDGGGNDRHAAAGDTRRRRSASVRVGVAVECGGDTKMDEWTDGRTDGWMEGGMDMYIDN